MCALLTLCLSRGKIDVTKLKSGVQNDNKHLEKIQRIHHFCALFCRIDTDYDAFAYSLPDKISDRNILRRLRHDSRTFVGVIA